MASTLVPPPPDSCSGEGGNDGKEVSVVTVADSLPSNSTTATTGKGSWKHAAFHVATTIATPAAYAPLPFAVSSLGWPLGVMSLVGATLTTWYSSLLIASLWKWDGKKHTTYRHLARSIYGSWGYLSIAFFQQVASLGNNIAIQIAAGSSLKAVYKYYHKDGSLTLQHFIIFFGIFELVLSQLPNIHSLRWLNAVCTFSTIGFAGTTIGVTIYNGKKIDRGAISYNLQGSSSTKMFKAFNGLGVIAFSFGDAMLPEIQNTVREPAKKTMYKGIAAAYTIILLSYWQLAFLGYWAFGADVQPFIVASLKTPEWTIVMANIFAVIQISGCFQIYCRPTYAYFEENLSSSEHTNRFPLENHLQRLVFTSLYMGLITLVAAAMPFFGDFVSICGAVGFTPLDFVFPVLAHLKAGKMPRNTSPIVILNIVIATWFSAVAVMGCIGAVKFIIDDIKTYKFFHDIWISGGSPPPASEGDYVTLGDDLMDIPSPAGQENDEFALGPGSDFDQEEKEEVAPGPGDDFMVQGKSSIANVPSASGEELILQEKETVPSNDEVFIIQGKVYCDPCRIQFPTKISYALPNTKISLVCHKAETDEETYRVEGKSDEKGKYALNAVGDHAEEVCEISVSESPDPNCVELMDDENHVRVSLTNKHGAKGKGRYANPLGFMVTNADPRCKEALDELGFTGI